MPTDTLTGFAARYLQTWTASDAEQRAAAVAEVWAPECALVISPMDLTVVGRDAIAAHVGRVHADAIVGRRMTFAYDQAAQAGDTLLLRWSMLAPDGIVAGRGVDVVLRDEQGRATRVAMFMGID